MWIDEIISADARRAVFAGAAGGLVRWITLRTNWREGAGALVAGSIAAIYFGPIVAPALEPIFKGVVPGADPEGFAAFVVGLGGISLSGMVIDLLALYRKKGGKP